jgi:hypothetical protein
VNTVQRLTFDSYLFKDMATVQPFDHLNLAFEGAVYASLNWWTNPRKPVASAPPNITAKQAVHATRMAISAGVGTEDELVRA